MKLRLLILSLLFFIPSFGAQLVTKKNQLPITLIPKDIIFAEIIPHLSGNVAFNLARTCTSSYSELCNTQEDKIRLLSCSIPLQISTHRNALRFYAQQFNNTSDLTVKNNCEEFVRTLVTNESDAHKQIRSKVLAAFNKNDSVTDIIELYGRDYSKNNYVLIDIPSKKFTKHDLYILKLLCTQKFDPNIQDNDGQVLLHRFANDNHPECIEYLCNHFEFDPNIKDNDGNTPLHYAENEECTKYLIQHFDSNPNIGDNEGNTPLHLAVITNDAKRIALLLDGTDEPSDWSDEFLEFSKKCKGLWINPNTQNNNGDTPLHCAAKGTGIDHIKLLLDYYSINPNIKNNNGDTPLHCTMRLASTKYLKYVLENHKTDPNIKNHDGDTPLHIAIEKNCIKTIYYLLANPNINPNIKDKNGDTPLHKALQEQNRKIITLLLNHSAIDPNVKDKDGDTPFTCIFNYKNITQNEEVKYIRLFLKNSKTKLSLLQKSLIWLMQKSGELK